ncbi:MAG TPA: ABC transporter permease [Blastocatellia bacterium]|nr:ABC transporter permease [Blastocatellia bacterium]
MSWRLSETKKAEAKRPAWRLSDAKYRVSKLVATLGRRRLGRVKLGRLKPFVGLITVFALACVFSPARRGEIIFLDFGNLTDILRQVSEKGIIAVGMTFVILAGGIDLSVGSTLAFAATLSSVMLMRGGYGTPETVVTVLAAGLLVGAINAAVITKGRIQSFIVTLAMMSAARGMARLVSGGSGVEIGYGDGGAPQSFASVGAKVGALAPVPALIFLATVAMAWVVLNKTRFGRYVHAVGSNETASRLSGVSVDWVKFGAFSICSLLAALAGIIHCAQLEQGNPNDGVAYELDAIAAVVIGGTPLSGGVGTVIGTLAGTLIIGIINNILGLNNVNANVQLLLKGVIIVGAVLLQRK